MRILIYFLLFTSISIAQSRIEVKMDNVVNDSLLLINEDYFYFQSLDFYNEIEKEVVEVYKGIPANDSIRFLGYFEDPVQLMYDLVKSNKFEKETMLQYFSGWIVDTLKLSQTKIKQGLIIAVGFKGNKQFIVGDFDRNKDFTNDKLIWFDKEFRNNSALKKEKISKLPSFTYKYEVFKNGKIFERKLEMVLYPSKINAPVGDGGKYEMEYSTKFGYKNYWTGNLVLNGESIDIYLKPSSLLIKPTDVLFSKSDVIFNSQFNYRVTDIINIKDKKFKIESIESDLSAVYLTEILDEQKNLKPVVGNEINDFDYIDVLDKEINLHEFLNKKDFALIEYWGTWCGPCVQLTPKLKEIEEKYSDILSMLGIAVDREKGVVLKYLKKKKINWTQLFVDIKNKPEFILNHDIKFYPTFILVNKKREIIYIGGSELLDKLDAFIK